MQRRQSILLPGESAPHAFLRNGPGLSYAQAQAHAQTQPRFVGQPINRGGSSNAQQNAQRKPQTRAQILAAQERGARAAALELEQEYRAGAGSVNMDDYFKGVLSQFPDDSVVMNPMNVSIESERATSGADDRDRGDADAIITKMAQQAAVTSTLVDLNIPIARSAIDDTRIFFDTLVTPQAYGGYPTGEVPMQFVDFNGVSPPDRIVKITLSSFNFPHVYLPTSTVFDIFYFRSVFMTIRFIPSTNLIQTASPNELFTFELYVDNIDSSAVYLRPVEPSFILKQPISVTGDLTVKFQVRAPSGGFVNCPIPPTRLQVMRKASTAVPPATTFQLLSGVYIGTLAPPGATYSVPVLFQQFNPIAATTPLEDLFINATGLQASGFVTSASNFGQFTVSVDSTGIMPASDEPFFIFVPKNGISFNMRFSSLQSTRTNDLIPVHL